MTFSWETPTKKGWLDFGSAYSLAAYSSRIPHRGQRQTVTGNRSSDGSPAIPWRKASAGFQEVGVPGWMNENSATRSSEGGAARPRSCPASKATPHLVHFLSKRRLFPCNTTAATGCDLVRLFKRCLQLPNAAALTLFRQWQRSAGQRAPV
jgi:hypothetical protein